MRRFRNVIGEDEEETRRLLPIRDEKTGNMKLPNSLLHKEVEKKNNLLRKEITVTSKKRDIVRDWDEEEDDDDDEEEDSVDLSKLVNEKFVEQEEEEEEKGQEEEEEEGKSIEKKEEKQLSFSDAKIEIGTICETILENPEENIDKLTRLLYFATSSSLISVRKIAILSQLAVFKDILPGYTIHLPTEKEKQVTVSKDVKRLRKYERELLSNYQEWLKLLENCLKRRNRELSLIAMRCLCSIQVSKPHFNFRENILTLIIPRMANSDEEMSKMCCSCIETLIKEDVKGELSLDIVRLVSKSSITENALKTLLSLRLTADLKDTSRALAAKKARLARKKAKKREDDVQVNLLESDASLDVLQVHTYQADTLRELFTTFLRIIKTNNPLVPVALQGISKFVHLVNLDLMQSLIYSLGDLLQTKKLSCESTLQCVLTFLKALRGGFAKEIEIDENIVLSALHDELVHMETLEVSETSKHIPLVIECIQSAFIHREEVSMNRISIFIRRLGSLSLNLPVHLNLGLLSTMRSLLLKYNTSSSSLLDREEGFGIGRMLALNHYQQQKKKKKKKSKNNHDVGSSTLSVNPSTINATATATAGILQVRGLNDLDEYDTRSLWELCLLRHHFHPYVSECAQRALENSPLLPKDRPERLIEEYDSSNGGFHPQIRVPMKKETSSKREKKINFEKRKHDLLKDDDDIFVGRLFGSL